MTHVVVTVFTDILEVLSRLVLRIGLQIGRASCRERV